MRRAILAIFAVVLLASFATDKKERTILKDIDGTLLQSYVVVDNTNNTVTFETDANTTVSSSIINGEFKVFLIENGNSDTTVSHTLSFDNIKEISFDLGFSEPANFSAFFKKCSGYSPSKFSP